MKKDILFVGDYPTLWTDFKSRSSDVADPWSAHFARTAAEALALSAKSPFAAVVADLDLPDMSGVELLDKITTSEPRAVRIVVSDITDSKSAFKCVGGAHQHLYKPCSVPTILNALNQAIARESWLPGATTQGLLAQMRHLPSPPTIYFQIVNEMRSPEASMEKIAAFIGRDPSITAKLLQLANSAVFGLQIQVVQPLEAITYVGLDTVKALVLVCQSFAKFDGLDMAGFSVEALWRHSVLTGQFARRIARIEKLNADVVEQAFTAGLLHDLGKLMFAANLPQAYSRIIAQARHEHRPVAEIERKVLGADHAELGACALGIWGLPSGIVEAVALHHRPREARRRAFNPLTVVHAANVLEHEIWPDSAAPVASPLDEDYLREIGFERRVEVWRDKCMTSDQAAA